MRYLVLELNNRKLKNRSDMNLNVIWQTQVQVTVWALCDFWYFGHNFIELLQVFRKGIQVNEMIL